MSIWAHRKDVYAKKGGGMLVDIRGKTTWSVTHDYDWLQPFIGYDGLSCDDCGEVSINADEVRETLNDPNERQAYSEEQIEVLEQILRDAEGEAEVWYECY